MFPCLHTVHVILDFSITYRNASALEHSCKSTELSL